MVLMSRRRVQCVTSERQQMPKPTTAIDTNSCKVWDFDLGRRNNHLHKQLEVPKLNVPHQRHAIHGLAHVEVKLNQL